ncbi:geranylgeranyl diphosphate synthase, type II [Sporobacter termitidis DSM 10068]|uniref:Farnesyl diphosphate synthase n=1 Tax=Sporobacter termitidis DSM 10068 TaxID=1123282 RepID=A0A1M5Y7U7_9FIRM|nr:farnesyl diphosphate synthase [Sporobacter termitidis]SHI08161.1 geranylgeranyl diphosphate synthase, type II [Sporobacter termitidis DSM 10068]
MLPEEYEREYQSCRALIEARLQHYFCDGSGGRLAEAMRYSLLAGGKRIRPVMVLAFCRAAGGDIEKALPAACAVEMLHTYSLIHDDLPCMDNDALRRGKPTNHVVYGECMATLSGDALQAEAFNTLLQSELPDSAVVTMARTLAGAAGLGGICLGQALDMDGEGKALTLREITAVHNLKTASMLVASARMGVAAAGGSEAQLEAARRYALALGLAFQIRDDILDCTGKTDVLGKPAGSDAANNKTTFVTLYGVAECERLIREKTAEANSALRGHFANTDFLEALSINLEERKY